MNKIAQLIVSCLRNLDTAYRYGGEEFTVILPETPCNSALLVAERVNQVVYDEVFDVGSNKKISVSIGVTQFSPGETVNEFIRRSDKAMYMAKEGGRNRAVLLMPYRRETER